MFVFVAHQQIHKIFFSKKSMQTAEDVDNYNSDSVVKNLSNVAATAFKELEMAKHDIRDKESELKEIAEISSSKMNAAIKINSDLQGKIDLLQNLSTRLEEQNQDLFRRNEELKIKEKSYNNMNKELRNELEKVTTKEKVLAIKETYLEQIVEQKTKDISKAEKMATIGELTSRLAHDLRNPLSVLKTTHEIMKNKQNIKIEERLKYNSQIDRAIQKIIHLVDDVLDFVRVSDLNLQSFSIASIMDSAIESIFIPNDVKIKSSKNNFPINCDYRKIEAVFINLLTNSIQAVNNIGIIEIRISQKDGLAIIEIQDDGPGISDSDIPKIFDPLFTTKPVGTGLGLSICKSIVEQHGGSISVGSNPTTFKIILPQ